MPEDAPEPRVGWHVLWTRSNFEQAVNDQLRSRDYETFLPRINQWPCRRAQRKGDSTRLAPMFRGYLFLRHRIDKEAWLDISNTPGLVQILGASWNRLARIPDEEIEAIRRTADSSVPARPYPYLTKGEPVRIVRGPLANAIGLLVLTDFSRGYFVVSVHLLRRSVAVKVDCADVVPA
jgi:transcriptional antiterminator NusG